MTTSIALSKWGNGQGVRIPRPICDLMGIVPGDTLELTFVEGEIRLTKPVEAPLDLNDLFVGYEGCYRPSEWDVGAPVGREIG